MSTFRSRGVMVSTPNDLVSSWFDLLLMDPWVQFSNNAKNFNNSGRFLQYNSQNHYLKSHILCSAFLQKSTRLGFFWSFAFKILVDGRNYRSKKCPSSECWNSKVEFGCCNPRVPEQCSNQKSPWGTQNQRPDNLALFLLCKKTKFTLLSKIVLTE